MKAMILAAGLGKRLRPLTEHTPKPLLRAGDKFLIEYHLENIARTTIKDVIINTHWLAAQIPAALGDGARWGLKIHYSHEPDLLETAGGIRQALPMLSGEGETFLLVNGDVYSELDFAEWLNRVPEVKAEAPVHLALVENPEHNIHGDFGVDEDGVVGNDLSKGGFTYTGIGVYHTSFFSSLEPGPRQLGPLLKAAASKGLVSASIHQPYWLDVGTAERLQCLRKRVVRSA